MNRITFGNETRLRLGNGPSCPSCGTRRGSHHKPGCDAEECPSCENQALHCLCDVLPVEDQARIMVAVAATFQNFEAAMAVVHKDPLNESLYVRGAWMAVYRLATPEVRRMIDEGAARHFPDHRPDFYDDAGNSFMSTETMAKSLGRSVEDVEAMARIIGSKAEPVGDLHRVN